MNKSVEDTLQTSYYFVSALHHIEKPDFIETVIPVFDENVKLSKETFPVNELYPAIMTGNLYMDPRMKLFCQYIAGSAWNILNTQGYKMDDKITYFHSLWGHQYEKYGSMDEHVHNDSVQIVGFYFLDVPENGCKLVIHDPRPGKVQINLTEADSTTVTQATTGVVFEPKAGSLYFANSWLPHSFTRNGSDKPVKFIHFNVSIAQAPAKPGPIVI